jgi:hypothetical protein
MTHVNDIPELDGNNYGKWYQELEIALAMANIVWPSQRQHQQNKKSP